MAKKKVARRSAGDRNRIRQIIETIELVDIRLVRCGCAQMLKDDELPDNLETSLEVKGQFDKKSSMFLMLHGMRLVGTYESKSANTSPPLAIEAVFGARYELMGKAQISDKDLEAFGRTVSMFHVWPYWREFVRDVTARMGLPPLTMPIFRIPGFGAKANPASATKKLPRKKKK